MISGRKRAVDRQLLEREGGPQVGESAQRRANLQQAGLGPLVRGQGIELVAAHCAQQHRVGSQRRIQRVRGQRRSILHNGHAADALLGQTQLRGRQLPRLPSVPRPLRSVTSGPMPSPAVTRIFSFIQFSLSVLSGIGFPVCRLSHSGWYSLSQAVGSVQLRHRLAAPFANPVGQQTDQILIVDVLLAVGQRHKPVVDVLQLVAADA